MKFSDKFSVLDLLSTMRTAGIDAQLGPSHKSLLESQATILRGLNILPLAQAGDLVFSDTPKHLALALNSKAQAILCAETDGEPAPLSDKLLVFVEDPFRAFGQILQHLGKHAGRNASIGANTTIEQGAVVNQDVIIGSNCFIGSNAVIYPGTTIGDNVTIQAGSIIGSDGFYYQRRANKLVKLLSGGDCHIADNVEIGASCTIDRGVTGTTKIGRGTKIDNQVHVGHDTIIGANCLIAGCVGIAGTAVIEDDVTLWGQVGISCLVTVGAGAEVLAQSAVLQDVAPGKRVFGTPAQDARTRMKEIIHLKHQTQNPAAGK